MANRTRDIIVIGASAGGVEVLQQVVRTLPPNFPAAVFVTLHFPEHATSVLPRILSRAGPLPALHAADGDAVVRGRIYIAPPDHHLLLMRRGMRIVRGPKDNGNRPAIDPMFRSAAVAFGPRVIGVVLTGNLDDGTAGLAAIKRRGGLTVVQDPEEALFSSMPRSALEHVEIDRVIRAGQFGRTIQEIMCDPTPDVEPPLSQGDAMENEYSAGDLDAIEQPEKHPGRVSPYSCPDCGGVLWELNDGDFMRFRCRVGHGWTGDALMARQSESLDDALWTALRALEENAALSRQIAGRYRARGADRLARRLDDQAEAAQSRADVIRDALMAHRRAQPDADPEAQDPRRAS
jgi:two-component system chemotaxis response regulator CheB